MFLARNRKRAVLLFQAPDAESVRQALRHAQTPFDRIWSCAQDSTDFKPVRTED
jgi:hypothetical protein